MIISLKPRMSEKAYALSKERDTFVFDVPKGASRLSVADAVSQQYKVTVESVNLVNIKGKAKQSYRRRQRPTSGSRPNYKKAYVKLKSGDSIPIFAEVDAAGKDEEKK